jgi:type I restriction-modification system DNA methylase subunit
MAVGNNNQIEKRLWDAADELRANSKLKSSAYSIPVLGLIFLRYADHKFAAAKKDLEGKGTGRRHVGTLRANNEGHTPEWQFVESPDRKKSGPTR